MTRVVMKGLPLDDHSQSQDPERKDADGSPNTTTLGKRSARCACPQTAHGRLLYVVAPRRAVISTPRTVPRDAVNATVTMSEVSGVTDSP